ncbi:MAG: Bax inhibitor-1/YccA family protein [Betaproteobacteria bacterium]|nr:Bax inhibitor-1/YccA family protein [Betaproteobacteria bacterium]
MELKPVRTEEQAFGRSAGAYEPAEVAVDAAQGQRVLRNTYLLLAATMVPTIAGAALGIQLAGVMMANPILTFVIMLAATIGLQFGIAANRNSGVGIALLFVLTFVMGALLGPLLNVALSMRNGMQLVGYAAAGTGVIFFAMGAVATTTKRDFSFMGKFLFVGMIALLVAIVANMFLHIPALALTISTLVIVLFSLYLLYDLNRIVRGGETNYILATTGVYISLLNIFSSLLQLLLALGGDRD